MSTIRNCRRLGACALLVVAVVAFAGSAAGRPLPVDGASAGSDQASLSESDLRRVLAEQSVDTEPYLLPTVLLSGAIVMLVLLGYVAIRRWKIAFREREWTLVPNSFASAASSSIDSLHASVNQSVSGLGALTDTVASSREEFSILRAELEAQRAEIERLRSGALLDYQRSVLGVIVRSLEMIEADHETGVPADKTLLGVRVELSDALDDHGIEPWAPEPGSVVSGIGLDLSRAKHVPTKDPSLVGRIAKIHRRGFVYSPGTERRAVLLPPQLSVYVSEQ
jgi:hypothetical protein